MDLGIRGRKVLLCGASRGLGKAGALALAREGVDVIIVARNPDILEQAAAEIRNQCAVHVTTVSADITTRDGRARALAACPTPDILLNNADSPMPGDFREWDRAVWIAALDALMLSPIELMRLTIDGMIARGFGRIVNLSSRSVKIAQEEHALSNGARTALVGFVAGIARSSVRHNVTINNILPGPFASGAQQRHIEGMVAMTGKSVEQLWAERSRSNPARRFGEPHEFGALFAFLCSAHAGYITGQNVLIDGGGYPGTM